MANSYSQTFCAKFVVRLCAGLVFSLTPTSNFLYSTIYDLLLFFGRCLGGFVGFYSSIANIVRQSLHGRFHIDSWSIRARTDGYMDGWLLQASNTSFVLRSRMILMQSFNIYGPCIFSSHYDWGKCCERNAFMYCISKNSRILFICTFEKQRTDEQDRASGVGETRNNRQKSFLASKRMRSSVHGLWRPA